MVIEEFPPGMSSKPADIIRTSNGSAMKWTNLAEIYGGGGGDGGGIMKGLGHAVSTIGPTS